MLETPFHPEKTPPEVCFSLWLTPESKGFRPTKAHQFRGSIGREIHASETNRGSVRWPWVVCRVVHSDFRFVQAFPNAVEYDRKRKEHP
jgi:hypothetical protein